MNVSISLAALIINAAFTCGQPVFRRRSENTSLIYGGNIVDIYYYRFMAKVMVHIEEDIYDCGGAALSTFAVLTAAHCLNGDPNFIVIQVGLSSSHDKMLAGATYYYKTTIYVMHPQYRQHIYDYDIALVGVEIKKDRLQFAAAELPLATSHPPATHERVTLLGWGSTTGHEGDGSESLREVIVPVVERSECVRVARELLELVITDRMFCTGDLGRSQKNSCKGDSGGPVVNKDGVLVGIINGGAPCASYNHPSIHISTVSVRHWIEWQTGL